MRKEAGARIIRPEFGRNKSIVADNLVHVDFVNKTVVERSKIVGISGSIEIIPEIKPSNIVDFPKIEKPEISPIEEVKEAVYNPGKQIKELHKLDRKRFRIRRKSRCDGIHDAEEKPCGSPRCRTKNKVKLPKRKTAGQEKTTTVKTKNGKRRNLVFGR